MNLQQALDDVESVCRTCEECEPSCANNVFRDCIQSEIEYDKVLQSVMATGTVAERPAL